MDYKKPQSTLVQGGKGIYPLTTADQVILADGSRLEKDGRISADSAANSAKLGGKAPEYYIQPRNLLDNSDFRNPVNQRGITSETSVSAYSYFIDRWVNQSNEARSFTLSTSGIGLTPPTTLLQKIEKIEAGKIVTFAIKLSDGTIATLTGTVQYTSDGSWTRFASITHSFGDMYMETMNGFVNVVVYNTETITIEWAALYEGSYTVDTLPPYVPKGYASELAECQRYLPVAIITETGEYKTVGVGAAISETEIKIVIPVPTSPRKTPIISCDGIPELLLRGGSFLVPMNVSADISSMNAVTITCTVTVAVVGAAYELIAAPGVKLLLLSEL